MCVSPLCYQGTCFPMTLLDLQWAFNFWFLMCIILGLQITRQLLSPSPYSDILPGADRAGEDLLVSGPIMGRSPWRAGAAGTGPSWHWGVVADWPQTDRQQTAPCNQHLASTNGLLVLLLWLARPPTSHRKCAQLCRFRDPKGCGSVNSLHGQEKCMYNGCQTEYSLKALALGSQDSFTRRCTQFCNVNCKFLSWSQNL